MWNCMLFIHVSCLKEKRFQKLINNNYYLPNEVLKVKNNPEQHFNLGSLRRVSDIRRRSLCHCIWAIQVSF